MTYRLYITPFPRYSAAKEVENHPTILSSQTTNERTPMNFAAKFIVQKLRHFAILSSDNRVILTSAISSQYSPVTDRQTTDRQKTYNSSCTLQCNYNVRLKVII